MAKVNLKIEEESEKAVLYSLVFEDGGESEFQKFLTEFENNAEYKSDLQRIVSALSLILNNGVLERYFRPEGKMNDKVCALPIVSNKLRLYCLRVSDEILIVGNGGVKDSRTYNENPLLSGYVLTLQKFNKILNEHLNKGGIRIESKRLAGAEEKDFEI